MISKNDLKGKYVIYVDKYGKQRTERVVKINGNYLTVRHSFRINGKLYKTPKRRIHLDAVIGRIVSKCRTEQIDWSPKK